MHSIRDLKFLILAFLRDRGRRNKWNALGNPGQPGDLELYFGRSFDPETRARAERAWNGLQAADLIRSDYGSTSGPADWVEITDAGRRALVRHALDALDEALAGVDPRLVEMRDAAWTQLDGRSSEDWRQASGSMAELVDQLLHSLAPDEKVRSSRWYEPVQDARSKISRFQRARLAMEECHGRHDEDRCRALIAAQDELTKLKHSRKPHGRETV